MLAAVQSLFLFYDIRSRSQEGAEMFGVAYDVLDRQGPSASSRERSRRSLAGLCSVAQGWFLRFTDPSESVALVRRGNEILEALGTSADLAFANVVGCIVGVWPVADEAVEKLRNCADLYESIDDPWGKALTLEVLSYCLQPEDARSAQQFAQESLRLRRHLGDRWGVALSLFALGWIAEKQGMPHAAKKRYEESLKTRKQLGLDLDGIIECLNNMARVARRMGDYDESVRLFEECLRISGEIGNQCRMAQSLTQLGMIACDVEQYERARQHFEEAQPMVETRCEAPWMDVLLSMMANAALATDDREEARFLMEQTCSRFALNHEGDSGSDLQESKSVGLWQNPWRAIALGRLAARSDQTPEAREHLVQALRVSVDDHDPPTALEALIEIADLERTRGVHGMAAEILSFILAQPVLSLPKRARVEALMDEVRSVLSTSEMKSAVLKGKDQTLAGMLERMNNAAA
jgi:tetratricopeptide (TPR) repeat protein